MAVRLFELFDEKLYQQMLEEKFIRTQTNADGSLTIVNYTERAQFAREWNDVTLNCRGLIYNTTNLEVIARGFKKFFNWDDSSQPYPPKGPCIRAPKMDGSLGIMYVQDFRLKIATRGSFASDQAIWATEKFESIVQDKPINVLLDHTYLFEIIYPENRIVVDYGDDEKLVLLDVLDTATGKSNLAEFDAFEWDHKVEKVSMPGFQDTMASDIPAGDEGFVFYWPERDFRVKMKSSDYVELHRMIFGLNARSVWQRMGEGESIEDIAVKLPDEFHPWVKQIGEDLIKERDEIISEAKRQEHEIRKLVADPWSRKEFALMAMKYPLKSYLFLLYDGKDIEAEVWKNLRPAGGIGISTRSEDAA